MTTLNPNPPAPKTQVNINTQILQQQWSQSLQQFVQAQKQLSAQELQDLTTFSTQLFPLIAQQSNELISSQNPRVQLQNIQGLVAAEVDKLAQVAGQNIIAQKQLIQTQALQWITNLATAIVAISRNPVLKVLIQAGVATLTTV